MSAARTLPGTALLNQGKFQAVCIKFWALLKSRNRRKPPPIWDALEATPPGKGGEIQLTDALQLLLKQQAIYAYEFEGARYDTGTPLGWLKTTIAFALKRTDIGQELKEYLQQLL